MLSARTRQVRERGQVVVLFALLLPVILTFGSIVMSAGNWYVLQRHLQTQADAAALASAPDFLGCGQQAPIANVNIVNSALKFSGDTLRSGQYNLQLEEAGDQRAVVNSTRFWQSGDATDGSTLDNSLGLPCDTKFLDVKITDDRAPLLFRWIPLFPSLKKKARVEMHAFQGGSGIRPIGVPEVDPTSVAVVFVNEDAPGGVNSPGAIVGKSLLSFWDPKDANPANRPPAELAGVSAWHQDVTGVNFNGNENYSAVVVASRDPGFSLNAGNGSLQAICNQNAIQTHCYGPGTTLQQGISFIHSYSDAGGGSPAGALIRGVDLFGGCGTVAAPYESNPYFNVDDGTSCAAITIHARIDFGVTGDPTGMPTCAQATASPGGAMTWVDDGSPTGAWETAFVPAIGSGRNVVNISTAFKRPSASNCNTRNSGASFPRVAVPYLADDDSGVVQYIRLDSLKAPFGLANSINGNGSTSDVRVAVGLTLPLRDADPLDPPIPLRIWNTPSQSQALDCGVSGSSGWNTAMEFGCPPYQIYNQAWHTSGCSGPPTGVPAPDPPDCIASQNGNFQQSQIQQMWASPCSATPNNWYRNGITVPPFTDKRWIPLFIVDEKGFTQSGKKYYPVRRFGGFYVTAGSGMNCPFDDPPGNLSGKRTIYGHFVTYLPPTFGDAIPADDLCTFVEGGVCVPVLVE
jgi:hypothetical protein